MLTRRQASLAAKQDNLESSLLLNAEDLESDTDHESSKEDSLDRNLAKAAPAKKVCIWY